MATVVEELVAVAATVVALAVEELVMVALEVEELVAATVVAAVAVIAAQCFPPKLSWIFFFYLLIIYLEQFI